MRKHEPYKSEVFVDESGKVQFKYQQENNGPCWPGYKQVGTKMKNGKEVPNCVPIDEYNEKVNVQKALKKVKGLTKGQIQALMTMPPPVLTSLINQLGMLVNSVEEETDDQRKAKVASGAAGGPNSSSKRKKVDEAPLVMSDMDIVKSLTQKIEDDLHKLKIRKQFEKGWSTVQALAKLAGYKVTKTAQQKGKTFRYDIKK